MHETAANLRIAQVFCTEVAKKLVDHDSILRISHLDDNRYHQNKISPWDASSLDCGCPALILLYSEMERVMPSPLWTQTLHCYVSYLIREVQTRGYKGLSLFFGLSGICFSLYSASLANPAYVKVHESCHRLLLQQLKTHPFSPHQFDVISGTSGIMSYLLHFHHQPEVRCLIEQMIGQILQITRPKQEGSQLIPGWLSAPTPYSPYAHFDTGMAHGISGCLAILSKALLLGIELPGQVASMRYIADWLQKTCQTVGFIEGVWPKRFIIDPKGELEIPCKFYFDAWSYGAPGILNALLLAAKSLRNASLEAYCLAGAKSLIIRLGSKDPGNLLPLCYGYAGVVAILHRMALHFNDPLLSEFVPKAIEQITLKYDASLPFGIRCLPPTNDLNDHRPIDNIGFLSGAIGVVLSTLNSTSDARPLWPSLLLLS